MGNGEGEFTRSICDRVISKLSQQVPVKAEAKEPEKTPIERTSVYDYDLSEFPIFFFHTNRLRTRRNEPLVYEDVIRPDKVPVSRKWTVYPGHFGFGGPSTQALLFDLIQLYFEQGAVGSQIQFGTLRSLFMRRGNRNPSKRDYERMRRDIDILRGYDFHCVNAFYDAKRRCYGDLKWRLFESVFYFKSQPEIDSDEMPFGFIELSSVFRHIVRERGFCDLGFGRELFHSLRPLEQRLAVYLSKKFAFRGWHKRFLDELARAIPIEAKRQCDIRFAVEKAAKGLMQKGYPLLERFSWEKAKDGRTLASFHRTTAPKQDISSIRAAAQELSPEMEMQLQRIAEAVGSNSDRFWWAQCIRRLGDGSVDRALGQLREAKQLHRVKNPGGLLTKIFKDISIERGIVLN